jgi:N-acetylglucosamine kinase-like BadF-type ATPase
MSNVPDLILALDAGGSSTRSLMLRRDGTVLGSGRGGPGNHILSGWDTARASIAAAVAGACAVAEVCAGDVAVTVASSAGVGANGEGAEVVEALLRELMPAARVSAVGDMVAAFWGALNTDFGVVVAAGTGSVCYGRNRAGVSRQVGGWGQIMGDEGSAYDIAVRALRAGARATDGRGPQTALCERFSAALGVGDFIGVAIRVYGEPMPRDEIAKLATTVAETAAAGDAVARDILVKAGRELGLAAITALRALSLNSEPPPVAYTGAVFDAGAPLVDAFCTTISAACPAARIAPAEFPPIIGAFKLALRAAGAEFTPAIAARLRDSWSDRA